MVERLPKYFEGMLASFNIALTLSINGRFIRSANPFDCTLHGVHLVSVMPIFKSFFIPSNSPALSLCTISSVKPVFRSTPYIKMWQGIGTSSRGLMSLTSK